jgi:nitrile hydratase
MSEHHHHEHVAIEDRVRALESLLVEKGITRTETIDRYLAWVEGDIGPLLGARIVARAWLDPDFRAQLLADAPAACAELGIDAGNLVVVENRPGLHNVVCCTLCSCYPWRVLGLPPTWYKSPAYRSRIVIEPRAVLREFGCDIPEDTAIRVWDSSSEVRYMVLPERPTGTERMSEDDLIGLIARDALVGVAQVPVPARA